MKKYLVTITYTFTGGRDFTATIPIRAKSEPEAIVAAVKELERKEGNVISTHKVAFLDSFEQRQL